MLCILVELFCHLADLSIKLVKIVTDGSREETIKVLGTLDVRFDLLSNEVNAFLNILAFF